MLGEAIWMKEKKGIRKGLVFGIVFMLIFVVLIWIPLNGGADKTLFTGGEGTPGNPFQITNLSQLQNMSANLSAHYVLMNDIDASNTSSWPGGGFQPVGTSGSEFNGSFNGRGYNITNLYFNIFDDYRGLFGYTNATVHISNVTLLNITIIGGKDYIGGLVGYNKGTIINCNSEGFVEGYNNVGGLIGYNSGGSVTNCIAYGNTIGIGVNSNRIGGLIGRNDGPVTDCISYGYINGTGIDCDWVGGLIGENANGGVIINCTAYGNTTGTDEYIGGLIGYNSWQVKNCHAHGNSIGDWVVGGLIGENAVTGQVINCSATGNATVYSIYTGGLIGYNYGQVINCYAHGNSNGYMLVGGLIGENTNTGKVTNCHVTGNVSGTGYYIGGLIGDNYGPVINCSTCGRTSGPVDQVGGLLGENMGSGTITNCISYGYTDGFSEVGGIIGTNYGKVTNCSAFGNTTGNNSVGGITGYNAGTLTKCYTTGVTSGDPYVGGLIGYNSGTINNSYSHSNITGKKWVGGLIGINKGGTVTKCYSKGNVSGNSEIGGLIGNNSGTVTYCFWDNETSGRTTSDGGQGLKTNSMKNIYTFLSAGWDFCNIWAIKHTFTYPYFGWNYWNGPPIANNDVATVSEDNVLKVIASGVLANDIDPDGDNITITAYDNPSTTGAKVILAIDGNYVYDPTGSTILQALALNEYLIDTFNYTIDDSNGGVDTATVSINISGANDAPEAKIDFNTTTEDSLLNVVAPGVLSNDNDIDTSDTLSVQAGTIFTKNGASVTLNTDGSYSYDPTYAEILQALAVGNSIVDSFTYIVSDGNGGIDTAAVNITINGINDAPTANDDINSVSEDSGANPIDVLTNDHDLDSDSLSVGKVTQGNHGTVVITGSGSGLTYEPDANYIGKDSFTYTASDSNGGTDSATVTIYIDNTNDAPVWASVPEDQIITEGDPLFLGVLATDIDAGDTIEYSILSVPASGVTINSTYGAIRWMNTILGNYKITLSASDSVETISHVFNITVNEKPSVHPPTNNPPVLDPIIDQDATVDEAFSYQVTGTDPDAEDVGNLTFYLVTGPTGMIISGSGKILFIPEDNQIGKHVVTVGLTDSKNTTTASFVVTVSKTPPVEPPVKPPKNNPPVIDTVTDGQKVKAGEQFKLTITGYDPDSEDSQNLSFSLGSGPAGMVISKDGEILWIPSENQLGNFTFTVRLNDGKNETTLSFKVEVEEAERPVKPEEPKEPEKEEKKVFDLNEGMPFLILLLILGLIIGLFLGLVMRRKKEPTETEEIKENELEAIEFEEASEEKIEEEISEDSLEELEEK